jgi:hypothetical protein
MDLDDDLKVETPSPGAGADTGDVTVAPETVHATATAFSPRVATHSHYPDGTEEIVIGLLALDDDLLHRAMRMTRWWRHSSATTENGPRISATGPSGWLDRRPI